MDDSAFDAALIAAAFTVIARDGWGRFSVVAAANAAQLDLARARLRFADRHAVLMRFGALADGAALAEPDAAGAGSQERLFDSLMRRIDVLQTHRAGVLALFAGLPADPVTAAMLAAASLASMRWLLAAAGLPATGAAGALHAKGLLAVWLWTVRAWQRDDSPDLAATMAALDTALTRAAQVARSWPGASPAPPTPPVAADAPV